jgi:hypothetical protein
MIGVFAATGAASVALLAVVSATRIADIALTDGTTRTSINAMYQVLPTRRRLSAQTTVEGMGVPVAIAASGLLILVLNALPAALGAMLAALAVVCGVWSAAAFLLYRAYGPALVGALRHRRLLTADATLEAVAADVAVARRLLVSADARSARLGLELASTLEAPRLAAELGSLVSDPRLDVRLGALAGLSATCDAGARAALAGEVATAAASDDPSVRLRAATVLGSLGPAARAGVAMLLEDDDLAVRRAALESVQPGDDFALWPALRALADAGSAGAAADALERLGDAAVPSLAAALGDAAPGVVAARLVRAVARSAARDDVLRRHVAHRDRALGLLVMERLAADRAASDADARLLDGVFADDVAHARRILAAVVALEPVRPASGEHAAAVGPLRRALDDELRLVRARAAAGRIARHGRHALEPAVVRLERGGAGSDLAVEALEVVVGRPEAASLLAVLDPALGPEARLTGLGGDGATQRRDWLRDLVEDPEDAWRAPWLRACAIRAARHADALGAMDLRPARGLRDPVVDEELALAAAIDVPA